MKFEIVVSIPVRDENFLYVYGIWNEFRIDFYNGNLENLIEKLNRIDKKIVTIRDRDEGGFYAGNLDDKMDFLKKIKNGIIDIEIKHLDNIDWEFFKDRRLILSAHKFNGSFTLKEIENFLQYSELGLIKIAMKMEKAEDFIDVALENRGRLLFVDLSGNVGNRILFSLISGTFFYTYLNEKLAEGQIHFKKALRIFESIE